ncbi:MAG: winged helix-turn-helix domain-containing protein [Candidatus Bathyarchaeota archaeon]|nr:MAG: winged helix-turn-helix domain-containing protein [Candidatus Bathyarchaeota archaeon]
MQKRVETSRSKVRKKILETLWEAGKMMRSWEIAERMGISIPSSTMNLLRLIEAGYVSTPQRGHYTITVQGRELLGLSKIDREQASRILNPVPSEKVFRFYKGMDQSLQVFANSIDEFCGKIQTVDVKSLEFHVPRRDFELWFEGLGDVELAEKMGQIRRMSLSGEHLRKKIYETVRSRCEELKRIF